jgi:hypothetical protein
MTVAPASLHPSRRSLLLSGALLGSLGLAGCDPATGDGETERADPPPTLSMEPMRNHGSTIPAHAVFSRLTPIAPVGDRPFAALTLVNRAYEAEMVVLRPDQYGEESVPIDPGSSSVVADDSAVRARVITSSRDEGEWRSTLLTSENLTDWEETSLAQEVDLPVEAAGDGLVASIQDGARIGLWEVSDDGAVAPLTPLEVPEGQQWRVQDLAREDSTIVLLLEVVDLRSEQISDSSSTLLSADGGKTWSAPVPVVEDETDRLVVSIWRHGKHFVVLGGTRVRPEWAESASYWRPTSWVSDDGKDFREAPIPLPRWGLDGWTWGEKGEVNAQTEMDMMDLDWRAPVVLPDGGAMHLAITYENIHWIATRDAKGTWTVSERRTSFEDVIDEMVAVGDTAVVAFPGRVTGAALERDDRGADHWQTSWEGVSLSPGRRLITDSGLCGTPVSLLFLQSTREFVEDTTDSSTEVVTHRGAWAFMVDGEEMATVEGLPEKAWQRDSLALRALEPGVVLVLGIEQDEEGANRLRGHVTVEGDWVETSLDVERPSDIRSLTTIDGIHHLCIVTLLEDGDRYRLSPLVLTSSDGVEWEEPVSPEAIDLPDEGAELGARILRVEKIDETIVGVGSTVGEDRYFRAASFVLEGERWKVLPLEGVGLGSTISSLDRLGEDVVVRVWMAGLEAQGHIDAQGTVTLDGEPTEDVRGRIIDLGEGMLVAPGELLASESGPGYGSCIWASRDGGASWGATVIPGAEGHAGTVHLLVDGDDLVALTSPGGAVVSHRIVDPRAQLSAG